MKLEAKSPIRNFLIFCIVGFLLYLPTLRAPFCFDDQIVIIHNPLIQGLSTGWKGIVDVWNFQHSRFLTNLTLAINFAFHGLNTFGYHLINLFIHILTALGVCVFANQFVKTKSNEKPDLGFWAGLLFLVHPVNTEAVSYISQRSSSLVALFYIWSVFFYLVGRQKHVIGYMISALLFGLLAIMSKETAVTLPLAWLLIDYFVLHRRPSLLIGGTFIFLTLCILVFFNFEWKELLTAHIHSQSHRGDLLTPFTYLITQTRVLVVLFSLIPLPLNLNIDYDFPMSHSLLEPSVLASLTFLSALIIFAFVIRRSYSSFSFMIFWFFISLLPHLIPPRANIIAEHKLYLTLVLFVPFFCYGLYQIVSTRVFKSVIIALVTIFSLFTFFRNNLWADPVRLWESTLKQSPQKARVYLNLGMAYSQNLQFPEAIQCYKKVIGLAPEMPEAYVDLSETYYNQAERSLAMGSIEQGIQRMPEISLLYIQRGLLYARDAEDDLALRDFDHALKLNSKERELYKMRGMIYLRLHQYKEALSDFNSWLKWFPKDEDVLSKRADIFFQQKNYQMALSDYNHLISINPNGVYYYNRSVLNEILGNHDEMISDRKKTKALGFKR